jgi:uncharacterized protein YndB with AHSA1/START domain
MEKLHFKIRINAPREKVWDSMLNEGTYKEWTKIFNTESRYEGAWITGNTIRFLGVDEHGKQGGMVSTIIEARPYEFVSIRHIGIIKDGTEDTESDEAKRWAGFENYTFTGANGGTELSVDVDTTEEYTEYLKETWPKALENLKNIAERDH